ncbi:hypothetical protein ACSBOB_12745 [Mesorhizobium sp. ASY16-5R]|uniref:hypothetical protein n=1 Tax=Mesorhizobium sp. ASY16-5R TaxID=3445772 RepID=UPI003FA04E2A
MRIVPKAASKGSQKWLQYCVEHRPDLLQVEALGPVGWVSPIRGDDFAEYRDGQFLGKVKLSRLSDELAAFWPARGPQWDGLGLADGKVVLVEAKSHLRELLSPPSAAGPVSRLRIEAALKRARGSLGNTGSVSWVSNYYQLANRLAHLDFLRSHGIDAHLLLVGFINDHEMTGPRSTGEWARAYATAFQVLGLDASSTASFVHHVHPDVAELREGMAR